MMNFDTGNDNSPFLARDSDRRSVMTSSVNFDDKNMKLKSLYRLYFRHNNVFSSIFFIPDFFLTFLSLFGKKEPNERGSRVNATNVKKHFAKFLDLDDNNRFKNRYFFNLLVANAHAQNEYHRILTAKEEKKTEVEEEYEKPENLKEKGEFLGDRQFKIMKKKIPDKLKELLPFCDHICLYKAV